VPPSLLIVILLLGLIVFADGKPPGWAARLAVVGDLILVILVS